MEVLNIMCPNCYALLVKEGSKVYCIFCGWEDDGTVEKILQEYEDM